MKSSYKLDYVNIEFCTITVFACIYNILFEELKIQFFFNKMSFKIILNYAASIRNVVAEFQNLFCKYSITIFSVNDKLIALKLPGFVDVNYNIDAYLFNSVINIKLFLKLVFVT